MKDKVNVEVKVNKAIMSDEVKKQLLGILPFSADATEKFTPSSFDKINEQFKPVFELKPMNKKNKDEMIIFQSQDVDKLTPKEKILLNDKMNNCIRMSVVGIENLYDLGINKLIEFETDKNKDCCSNKLWERIPSTIRSNLYFKVSIISGLMPPDVTSLGC